MGVLESCSFEEGWSSRTQRADKQRLQRSAWAPTSIQLCMRLQSVAVSTWQRLAWHMEGLVGGNQMDRELGKTSLR